MRFANDLRRDKIAVWLNQTYAIWAVVGLALPTLLGALWLGGWTGALKGFLWGGMVRLFELLRATHKLLLISRSILKVSREALNGFRDR